MSLFLAPNTAFVLMFWLAPNLSDQTNTILTMSSLCYIVYGWRNFTCVAGSISILDLSLLFPLYHSLIWKSFFKFKFMVQFLNILLGTGFSSGWVVFMVTWSSKTLSIEPLDILQKSTKAKKEWGSSFKVLRD